MFIPVQNAVGRLLSPISDVANIISVDPGLIALLAAKLGYNGTDHTYLVIGKAPLCEVVKVSEVNAATLVIARGQDETTPRYFTTDTPLQYVLTAAAVADITQAITGTPITLSADYPLYVNTLGPGEYAIGMEEVEIRSVENSISITGEFPQLEIDVDPQYLGCCSGASNGGGGV